MHFAKFVTQLLLLLIILWTSWYISRWLFSEHRLSSYAMTAQYERDRSSVSTRVMATYPWLDALESKQAIDSIMHCIQGAKLCNGLGVCGELSEKSSFSTENGNLKGNYSDKSFQTTESPFIDRCVQALRK
jgi:hypothetical protein